jgi:hypothetical protein
MENYRVTGTWEGEEIDESVEAYSPKQAKLKAGFSLGLSGSKVGEFTRSNKIRVSRR